LTLLFTSFGLFAPQPHSVRRAVRLRAVGSVGGVPDSGDEPSAGRPHQGFQRAAGQGAGINRTSTQVGLENQHWV